MMKARSYNTFLVNKASYFLFPNLDKAASIIHIVLDDRNKVIYQFIRCTST